jgi:hypothetical protein
MKRKTPCKKKNIKEIQEISNISNIQNDKNYTDNKIKILDDKIKIIDNKIKNIFNESLIDGSICQYCKKQFDIKGNLKRHMNNSCSERKKLHNEKENLIKEKEIIEKFINNNQNQNQNLNLNKNINNKSIKINPFGCEDISHITPVEYKEILSSYFVGFMELIKKVHFDDRMPSNHNVYIPNIDSEYAYIFEDNKWIKKRKNDIIEILILNKRRLLNNKCCELYNDDLIDENTVDLHVEFNKILDKDKNKKI